MESVESLVEGVKELVSLPEVYTKIRELYADEDSSIGDFEQVVNTDPGLCMRVLRISNSAFFGFATQIDSIPRALMIMGTSQLHDLVLATSAIKAFDGIPNKLMDMATFWRRSIHCGVIARLLGSRCNVLDTDRLFLTGLLHDIGHLIIYSRLPEKARVILERSRIEHRPVYVIERELLGFDYAEVGGELMRSWGLTEPIVDTVNKHLVPEQAGLYSLETSIIHLANVMVISHELNADPNGQIPAITPVAWQVTGLNEEAVEPLIDESVGYVEEAISLFVPTPRLKAIGTG